MGASLLIDYATRGFVRVMGMSPWPSHPPARCLQRCSDRRVQHRSQHPAPRAQQQEGRHTCYLQGLQWSAAGSRHLDRQGGAASSTGTVARRARDFSGQCRAARPFLPWQRKRSAAVAVTVPVERRAWYQVDEPVGDADRVVKHLAVGLALLLSPLRRVQHHHRTQGKRNGQRASCPQLTQMAGTESLAHIIAHTGQGQRRPQFRLAGTRVSG